MASLRLVVLLTTFWLAVAQDGQVGRQQDTVDFQSINIVYNYSTVFHSSKCLDLPGNHVQNGAKLWIWDCNGHDSQKWYFTGNGDGQLQKLSDRTKCVDVAGTWEDGTQLQLWDCQETLGQLWGHNGLQAVPWYLLKSETDASKCMDLEGGNTRNGSPVVIWDCNNGVHQKWAIPPIKTQKVLSNVTVV